MKYTHLTQDERYQIAILAKAGQDKSEIARLMERHQSTIGREMTRNRGARGYRPKQAQARSQSRIRAHPYASWERGANENMNGLIRQSSQRKWPSNPSR